MVSDRHRRGVGMVFCQSFGKGYDSLRLGNGRFLSGKGMPVLRAAGASRPG